jgi:hypothetical protein
MYNKANLFETKWKTFFFLGATAYSLGLPPWNSPFHFCFPDLRQSVGLLGRVISSSQGLYQYTNTEKRTHTQILNVHALSGIPTHDPGFWANEDSACLRPLGYRDRQSGRHRLCEICEDIKGMNFKEWPRVGYTKMGAYKNGET